MAKIALTAKSVAAFMASAKPKQERFDAIVPGFGVRADGKGSGSWALVYVAPVTGKRRRFIIAPVPSMTLADARAKAGELKAGIAAGIDPAEQRQAQAAATATEAADVSGTFAAIWATYYKRHASKLARGEEMQQIVDREVMKAWGDRKIAEITRYDVAELTGGLADDGRGPASRRLFSLVRGVFNFAIEQGLARGMETAPTDRLKAPVKAVARDRVLSDEEIRKVWSAFDVMPAPFGPMFKALLLTGQRRSETASMKWSDIQDDVWTIPASDTKTGAEHTVHLSPLMLSIIAEQRRVSFSPYVFHGRAEKPASGFGPAKRRADDLSEVTDWRLHDLRRTCRTGMARLGVPVMVAERVLNHALGGLIAVYDQHSYSSEMADAWRRWSDHVDGLTGPSSDKVVPIRRTELTAPQRRAG